MKAKKTAKKKAVSVGRRLRKASDNRHVKVHAEWIDIHSIQPYKLNPRDNEAAIESVANSIKLSGFLVPIVVDKDGVIAAGHTRVEAAKRLQLSEVFAVRAEHLTEDQIRAFRLIDNKVSELAKWDFDLLAGEIQGLSNTGINLTDFGWQREELDCLTDVVQGDCLSADGLVDAEARERISRAERRAPATARFVLGELVFFIPATEYRNWIEGLRALHDFDEPAMVADVKERLRILSASGRRNR